jgi:hypothetical protein
LVGLLHFLSGSEDEALAAVCLCEEHLSPKPVHKKTTPLRGPYQHRCSTNSTVGTQLPRIGDQGVSAVLAMPPGNLQPHKRFADIGYFSINETALRQSQLPERIYDPAKKKNRMRPPKWS